MSCQYLTIKETAAWLSVSVYTVRKLVKSGELPSIKVATVTRIAVCEATNTFDLRNRSLTDEDKEGFFDQELDG